MKTILLFCVLITVNVAVSQTYLPITDNMEIPSNSWIKFLGGTYLIGDYTSDGVIKISGKENIILDGDSCTVQGGNFVGFLFLIENSSNIIIRNFDLVNNYRYAIKAINSSNVQIYNNNLSFNKKDTTGWINVWGTVAQALGGGVLLDQCNKFEFYNNLMTQQNDGIAMYGCDSIYIHDNTLNWNCGFGIRMNFTNNCSILHNDCSHVNRQTDPSDCAAILLIVSNNNRVEYNDLSYSGDGIFLGQYEYHSIPNNNYFAWNECSNSPHNAIEATFADGNVYKHNLCNFSHYGLWLGYSFNSIVDSNQIVGNYNSGIAIDRGFQNTITHNEIKSNPYGIELWEGGTIPGYENQFSHDYFIAENEIIGNTIGITAKKTEHLVVKNNLIAYNQTEGIYFEGESFNDTITENIFKLPTFYHMRSTASDNIFAQNNAFIPSEIFMIGNKISGNISWNPFNQGPPPAIQSIPPCDMAEPDAIWMMYPEVGYGSRLPETLEYDYTDKVVGQASVKFVTGRGWDCGLNFRPAADSVALWTISESDTLYVWMKSIKQPQYGFQFFHIRIGNYNQGYYKYTANANQLNQCNLIWKLYKIPITGNSTFVRSVVGNMTLTDVNYVEIHADTWDYGFTLWVDGLQFEPCTPTVGTGEEFGVDDRRSVIFPNPVTDHATISSNLKVQGEISISILDLNGHVQHQETICASGPGNFEYSFSVEGFRSGVYFYRINYGTGTEVGKFLIAK